MSWSMFIMAMWSTFMMFIIIMSFTKYLYFSKMKKMDMSYKLHSWNWL